jgi:hypothetical protein
VFEIPTRIKNLPKRKVKLEVILESFKCGSLPVEPTRFGIVLTDTKKKSSC